MCEFYCLSVTLYEIEGIIHEAKVFIDNLKSYASPDVLPFNLLAALDKGMIEKVPFGVVLILGNQPYTHKEKLVKHFVFHSGAWNYPFLLSLQPMIGTFTIYLFNTKYSVLCIRRVIF